MLFRSITALRGVMDSGNAEDIKTKTDALMQVSMKVGEALYKATQEDEAGGAGDAASASSKPDDGVVDADFEEVDEKKNK